MVVINKHFQDQIQLRTRMVIQTIDQTLTPGVYQITKTLVTLMDPQFPMILPQRDRPILMQSMVLVTFRVKKLCKNHKPKWKSNKNEVIAKIRMNLKNLPKIKEWIQTKGRLNF